MTIRRSLQIQFVLFVVVLVYALIRSSALPDPAPIHWNAQGQVDGYGSKWVDVLLMPAMGLLMLTLTAVLPAISPKKFEIARFSETYAWIMLVVSLLMAFLAVLVLESAAGAKLDMTRWMMAGMFAFFAILGNMMGKVKKNFFVGIRTPWTLADDRVWDQTHRQAARLWFFGGIVGTVLALAGIPLLASVGFLMVISFMPVIGSYVNYRRIVR